MISAKASQNSSGMTRPGSAFSSERGRRTWLSTCRTQLKAALCCDWDCVGIGKSFAYLMPILLYNSKTFHPVVIATSTIALQEQLLSDMELLKKWLRLDPDLILAKGKNHIFVSKMWVLSLRYKCSKKRSDSRRKNSQNGVCEQPRRRPSPEPL